MSISSITKRIFIAGHLGMVGSAIYRKLEKSSNFEIITRSRNQLNLLSQDSVNNFFKNERIDQIYLAAARVGGIHANNTYPAEFIYENIMIQSNIIDCAHRYDVQDLIFLGSSCIYPKLAPQPMKENALLTGALEETNEPYAIAKIAGIKMCESYNRQYGRNYRSVMPTNLYGPNDNFNLENSHVIPALIRKFHDAKLKNDSQVLVWGSGKPMREFLHVDDMASASIFVMNLKKDMYRKNTLQMLSHINVGFGEDHTISNLVQIIAQVIGYEGDICFDITKPDGAPRKLMCNDRLSRLGWSPKIDLKDGIEQTYDWFLKNETLIRK
jgi:GDP-L-fucose synthase